jgi:hypothetical protein
MMLNKTVLIIGLCTLLASAEKLTVAINDLIAQGVEPETAAIISERLRAELFSTAQFQVMERDQMAEILKEQGFQQTGCVDNACAVEIGKLIGVDHIIMGTVGQVGAIYTISLRLVNVASAEVLYTASEDCKCPIEEMLTKATRSIVQKLDLAILQSTRGTLVVRSEPVGATVSINKSVIGKTNYSNDRFEPGAYDLEISLAGYDSQSTQIEVEPKRSLTMSYTLEHTQPYRDSVTRFEHRRHLRNRIISQSIMGVAALACGSLGYFFDDGLKASVAEKQRAYSAYQTGGEASDFNRLWDSYENAGAAMEKQCNLRNVFYGGAAIMSLGFGISFLF